MAGVQDAVDAVVSILGMCPCDGTDAVPPNARSHTVLLSGNFRAATELAAPSRLDWVPGLRRPFNACGRLDENGIRVSHHTL